MSSEDQPSEQPNKDELPRRTPKAPEEPPSALTVEGIRKEIEKDKARPPKNIATEETHEFSKLPPRDPVAENAETEILPKVQDDDTVTFRVERLTPHTARHRAQTPLQRIIGTIKNKLIGSETTKSADQVQSSEKPTVRDIKEFPTPSEEKKPHEK